MFLPPLSPFNTSVIQIGFRGSVDPSHKQGAFWRANYILTYTTMRNQEYPAEKSIPTRLLRCQAAFPRSFPFSATISTTADRYPSSFFQTKTKRGGREAPRTHASHWAETSSKAREPKLHAGLLLHHWPLPSHTTFTFPSQQLKKQQKGKGQQSMNEERH